MSSSPSHSVPVASALATNAVASTDSAWRRDLIGWISAAYAASAPATFHSRQPKSAVTVCTGRAACRSSSASGAR